MSYEIFQLPAGTRVRLRVSLFIQSAPVPAGTRGTLLKPTKEEVDWDVAFDPFDEQTAPFATQVFHSFLVPLTPLELLAEVAE